MSDLYNSMTQLVRNEDEFLFETINRHSNALITAIHGGGIEAGTSEIAQCIAQQSDSNYFSFKGLKNKDNFDLHVTSTNYDYPMLVEWSRNMGTVVAMHGFKGDEPITYVGGRDKQLATLIVQHLRYNGFCADIAPKRISCKNPNNITNKTKRGEGVQLEMTTKQRKMLFKNNDFSRQVRENSVNWSDDMYLYAESICNALESGDRL